MSSHPDALTRAPEARSRPSTLDGPGTSEGTSPAQPASSLPLLASMTMDLPRKWPRSMPISATASPAPGPSNETPSPSRVNRARADSPGSCDPMRTRAFRANPGAARAARSRSRQAPSRWVGCRVTRCLKMAQAPLLKVKTYGASNLAVVTDFTLAATVTV